MKLIIFGSTGTIGSQLVKQALDAGHHVTAFARDLKKLNIKHPNLKSFRGDVLNYESVALAVRGHQAVLIALGAGRKGQVRSTGTLNILKAMESCGLRRLVCQTTLGCGDSKSNLNFFWKHIMFGWFLKEAYIDHEIQEEHLFKSNIDWTIIRPGAFTDGALTGNYRYGFPPDDRSLKLKVSRADVADFMLKQINSEVYLRKAAGISY